MEIRSGRPEEAEVIAELAARTLPMACPPGMAEEDILGFIAAHLTAERFAGYLADADSDVVVAEVDGVIVGYGLNHYGAKGLPYEVSGVEIEPVGILSKCYVDAAYHGSGIALALLNACVEKGRERGMLALWLNTNYANHRAMRFYEKHGWKHVGWRDFDVNGTICRDPVYLLML